MVTKRAFEVSARIEYYNPYLEKVYPFNETDFIEWNKDREPSTDDMESAFRMKIYSREEGWRIESLTINSVEECNRCGWCGAFVSPDTGSCKESWGKVCDAHYQHFVGFGMNHWEED